MPWALLRIEVRARCEHDVLAEMCAGGEHLLAGDHPLVAISDRVSPDGRRIGIRNPVRYNPDSNGSAGGADP